MTDTPAFLQPPQTHNQGGDLRRVGFEFEFAGLDVAEAAALLQAQVGGTIDRDHRFKARVRSSSLGEFRVEVDATLLKDQRYRKALEALGIEAGDASWMEDLEEVLGRVAATVVPLEIVTPPIPLDSLPVLERLAAALRAAQAKGTGAALRFAFGLHINPEVTALDAAALGGCLRSFLVLYDWLMWDAGVDLSRRLTPYVDPFPEEYRQLVLAKGYPPDLDTLVRDYLHHNPTRNRPLDLLPAFAEDYEELIQEQVQEAHLVKARPAFHFRLPDCRLDEPDWSVAGEWNRWVEVERLSADEARLERLCGEYLELARLPFRLQAHGWARTSDPRRGERGAS